MTRLLLLNLTDIVPDPNQPRKDFDPKKLRELAENIKAVGVKTPITVRPHGDKDGRPQYMIVVGERRWRASEWAGKECIPAVLAEEPGNLTDDAVYLHQLSENLHRENLNPVEKADFLKTRLDMLKADGFSNPVERLAEEIGVSKAWVTKNTAVLKYPEDIRALVRDGKFRGYRMLSRLAALKGEKTARGLDRHRRRHVHREFLAAAKTQIQGHRGTGRVNWGCFPGNGSPSSNTRRSSRSSKLKTLTGG